MSLPRVTVLFANGNLLRDISAVDGVAGLICSGTATAQMPLKTPRQIFNMADLAGLGVTGEAQEVTPASGILSVSSLYADGEVVSIYADGMLIATYTKTPAETSTALQAAAIRNAVSYGPFNSYVADGTGHEVAIVDDSGRGAAMNGKKVKIEGSQGGGQQQVTMSGGVSIVENEHLYRQVREFYDAVGGNQELWLMTLPDTMLLSDMVSKNFADQAPALLLAGGGRIRLLAVCRRPHAGYNGGSTFLDEDITDPAIQNANGLVEAQRDGLNYLRVLIEGVVVNANAVMPDIKPLKTTTVGVVLGGSLPDGSASVGSVLGRACRYGAHIKIGKVANGPLPLQAAYIGNKKVEAMSNLPYVHGLGYISFMTHPGKAGYYAGIDRMAGTDDYRLLAYGRLIDKAAAIAAAVYIDSLESEIELQPNGNIASHEVAYLRAIVSQQIQALMGDQISSHQVLIEENQNIVATGKLQVQLRIQPLGYASFIEVTVGLTATV